MLQGVLHQPQGGADLPSAAEYCVLPAVGLRACSSSTKVAGGESTFKSAVAGLCQGMPRGMFVGVPAPAALWREVPPEPRSHLLPRSLLRGSAYGRWLPVFPPDARDLGFWHTPPAPARQCRVHAAFAVPGAAWLHSGRALFQASWLAEGVVDPDPGVRGTASGRRHTPLGTPGLVCRCGDCGPVLRAVSERAPAAPRDRPRAAEQGG
mmetsp:Transcript_64646/g.192610  ORF Transcript_64646/g.192610 Transcript_64646/m.192610 type:complete len:208 (+) Transcript_64646:507-1130(+)